MLKKREDRLNLKTEALEMHCLNQPSLTAGFLFCSNLFVPATIVCTASITSIMPLHCTLSQPEQAIPNTKSNSGIQLL